MRAPRTREEIEKEIETGDNRKISYEAYLLEVLLDIRDLLQKDATPHLFTTKIL